MELKVKTVVFCICCQTQSETLAKTSTVFSNLSEYQSKFPNFCPHQSLKHKNMAKWGLGIKKTNKVTLQSSPICELCQRCIGFFESNCEELWSFKQHLVHFRFIPLSLIVWQGYISAHRRLLDQHKDQLQTLKSCNQVSQ